METFFMYIIKYQTSRKGSNFQPVSIVYFPSEQIEKLCDACGMQRSGGVLIGWNTVPKALVFWNCSSSLKIWMNLFNEKRSWIQWGLRVPGWKMNLSFPFYLVLPGIIAVTYLRKPVNFKKSSTFFNHFHDLKLLKWVVHFEPNFFSPRLPFSCA